MPMQYITVASPQVIAKFASGIIRVAYQVR